MGSAPPLHLVVTDQSSATYLIYPVGCLAIFGALSGGEMEALDRPLNNDDTVLCPSEPQEFHLDRTREARVGALVTIWQNAPVESKVADHMTQAVVLIGN
jgi:hypothetical protein